MLKDNEFRLNKFIGQSGLCSRREADRFIEKGQVLINGKKAQVGDKVRPGDKVMVNGQMIDAEEAEPFVFIAFNKPVGIVSTTEESERDNIVSFINYPLRIFPIGRLDKASQGLIFLTNNGDLVNKILRVGNNHEKEYLVTVDRPVNDEFIKGMGGGVPILGMMTKKCKVEAVSTNVFKITLVQGLNRQIRRMCEYFGYNVMKLERTRIMNIRLEGIGSGDFRDLTESESKRLFKLIEGSSSEANSKAKTKKRHSGGAKKRPEGPAKKAYARKKQRRR